MSKAAVTYIGDLETRCEHLSSGHTIETDAPKDNQGKGERFSPTDLLAVSLASCILTIMGIYAKGRQASIEGSVAHVEKVMSDTLPRRVVSLTVHVSLPHIPSESVRELLEKKALDCPVFHSLHPDIEKKITFSWGSM